MVGGIGARAINKLTDLAIRSFIQKCQTGKQEPGKLADGGGLYLLITPAGTPSWRIKYRHNGKERTYIAGTYPATTLEAARVARDKVKGLLGQGRDPVQYRRLERANAIAASGETFSTVAAQWLAGKKIRWSPIHYEKSNQAFERDILPRIGNLPVKDITPQIVSSVVDAILKRGVRETAAKILQHINGVFRFAQARGLRADNPAEPVHEILPAREQPRRRPALLTWATLGDVLRRAESAHLSPAVRVAHRLCAFTVARIGNVVDAEWAEFDLECEVATWTIPRAKMKARDRHHDHKIVLAPSLAEELRRWGAATSRQGFVFPSPQGGKHISRESLEKAYRVTLRLEGKHSPHGWRSALSTLARDEGFAREVVELTLDHIHDNEVARAYDRGERLEQRKELMYWWADQLSAAQTGPLLARQTLAAYLARPLRRHWQPRRRAPRACSPSPALLAA